MRFKRDDKRKVKATADLTPLIDVVFQLLIFFMLSSTFVVQTSIPIETPQAEGATQLEQKDVSITLTREPGGPDGEGMVYFESTPVDNWPALSQALAALKQDRPDALVLIRADTDITTGRLVRVMSIANNVGIQHYGIAAEPPDIEE